MSAEGVAAGNLSPRQLTRRRRRQAAARTWTDFRRHPSGLFGLGVLTFFIVVALAAPLLADSSGLNVTEATGGVLEPPSSEFWLGTDQSGRSVLTLLIWGARISLLVGLVATAISMVIGTMVGLASGHFRGFTGAALYRITEWFLVVPYLPLVIVLADRAGRLAGQPDLRHRHHQLAGYRAADPFADAVDRGAPLPGARPGARRR